MIKRRWRLKVATRLRTCRSIKWNAPSMQYAFKKFILLLTLAVNCTLVLFIPYNIEKTMLFYSSFYSYRVRLGRSEDLVLMMSAQNDVGIQA